MGGLSSHQEPHDVQLGLFDRGFHVTINQLAQVELAQADETLGTDASGLLRELESGLGFRLALRIVYPPSERVR